VKRQQDEAYVLGTQQLGDADLIVTLLARERGKVRGVARSARRSRRRFGGYLEPLSHVDATWVEREGRDLHRLESIEGRRSFAAMQSDPLRQAACAVLAEVTSCIAQEDHAEPEAFRLLGAVLDAMDQGGDPRSLLRYFEYWMLRLHGLAPDTDACGACSRPLDPAKSAAIRSGSGLVCAECARTGPPPTGRFRAADRLSLDRMRREPPTAVVLEGAGVALEPLLRGTLEAYAERSFRSYRHFNAADSLGSGGGDR